MAGLALKLAPNEQIMINGVVVENGPRRGQLLIKSENASVLRLRDALQEEDVIGSVSRAYYCAQRCVAGEITSDEAARDLEPLLAEILATEHFASFANNIEGARKATAERQLYRVMRSLKPLLATERDAAADK